MLGHDENGGNSLVGQICQQLVELQMERPFPGHSVEIAVDAINHDDPGSLGLHRFLDRRTELSGREFGGINLLQVDAAGRQVSL